MGALVPKNLRHLPFGGQSSQLTTHYIGASGSSFLSGGANDRYVPDMDSDAIVVAWEILNTDTSFDLLVRFGPSSGTFTAAAGQTLNNYITIKPGFSYNFPVFEPGQQVNDSKQGTDYSILLIQGSAGDATYVGMATVWDPDDE